MASIVPPPVVHQLPPPQVGPGHGADGTPLAETNDIIAQAARQAQMTATAKGSDLTLSSDDDYEPCEDDHRSTSEDISDDEMEARKV